MTTAQVSPDGRKIIGPAVVAERFGVDRKTVRLWAKAGRIPHFVTPAGRVLFYEDEVTALLEQSHRPATSQAVGA